MTDFEPGDLIATDMWPGKHEGRVTRVDNDSVYVHWNGTLGEYQMDPSDVRLVERAS